MDLYEGDIRKGPNLQANAGAGSFTSDPSRLPPGFVATAETSFATAELKCAV